MLVMKRNLTQILIISLLVAIMLGCLIGCGSNDSETNISIKNELGAFRNIPFGTKYNEALELMEKDLSEQNYYQEPQCIVVDNNYNFPIVRFSKVRLYDYISQTEMRFINEERTNNLEDCILSAGVYSITNETVEDGKTCYDYSYNKLKEKYGDGEKKEPDSYYLHYNTIDEWRWENEGTRIILSLLQTNEVEITYGSTVLTERVNEKYEAEKEAIKNNVNSGL